MEQVLHFMFGALAAMGWLLSGFASFIYWWTKDNDFLTKHIGAAFCGTIMGPIAFFAGWMIHGDHSGSGGVLVKRRK